MRNFLFFDFSSFNTYAFVLFPERVFHFFFAVKKETKQRKNPCRKDASTLLGTNAENSVKVSDLCYKLSFSLIIPTL